MRMRVWTLLSAISVCAATARGVSLDAGIEAEVGLTSAYVWRGQVINDLPCLQPALLFSAGNFNLDVWGTLDLVADDDTWERNRIDVRGRYAWERGIQILSAGLIAYIYHDGPRGQSKDTWEAMLGYTVDVPLLPTAILYYDIDRIDGAYGTVSLSHSFELCRDLAALDLDLHLGAADPGYLNGIFDFRGRREKTEQGPAYRHAAPVDLVGAALIPIHVRPQWILTPGFEYMTLVDRGLRAAVEAEGGVADKFFYSISFSAFF